MLSNMQNKQTYKDKNIHPTFTQVSHYNDTICGNSSVYMQNTVVDVNMLYIQHTSTIQITINYWKRNKVVKQ